MNETFCAYSILKNFNSGAVILKNNDEVDAFYTACNFFAKVLKKDVTLSPFYSYEIAPISSIPPAFHTIKWRMSSIYNLTNTNNIIFITNLLSMIQPVIKKGSMITLEILKDQRLDMTYFIKKLINMGYLKRDYVENYSEFSTRGSIVDIFSPYYDKPIRLDFFSDTVEDIRLFFIANQRTFEHLESVLIMPPREYKYEENEFGYSLIRKMGFSHLLDYEDFVKLKSFNVLDENNIDLLYEQIKFLGSDDNLFLDESILMNHIKRSNRLDMFHDVLFKDNASVDEKLNNMKDFSKHGCVILTCASNTRLKRVEKFLKDKDITFSIFNNKLEKGFYLSEGYLKSGFVDRTSALAFVSFEDLFGKVINRYHEPIRYTKKVFDVGSKVVHKNYGIGIYNGLKKLNIEGKGEDFIEIEYKDRDKLYIPIYDLDLVFEYNGPSDIDSLRSNRFKKSQEAARRSVKKILSELVHAYAKRQLTFRKGYIINALMYDEFQAAFEYEETPDQAKAIKDIENDLSSNKPMDRLICGDVAFGKTEIAMRACAICVFNNKQCVVMAPTTVLSIQHFKTFKERFENFPVNIALLNSFTTTKDKLAIINDLKLGKIDILITTHSVYSNKIVFSDLGLVVVDEEQRFGVKIKEHLKSQYPSVDMLYLSATPIPRTLNMSLGGIFDISVIKTPPLSRKPIETFVLKRRQKVIRDAILREMSRNGSVFFVHNRINELNGIKKEIDDLLPFIETRVVHAQMPKNQIKKTFRDFRDNKFNVLITTSIIESGLDFKNVNTIVVDDAQNCGLSDLYQLRGRVGRSDKVAYAYLLTKGELTKKAYLRLTYIREFIERGIGFNVALKDLEIRGSGNILGKDQSGSIKAIGFDTYMSLMEEAIAEMKNEPQVRDIKIESDMKIDIPDKFALHDEKFSIYKSISSAKNLDDLEEIKGDLEDKFGSLPQAVLNIIDVAAVKILAKKVFVKKLNLSKGNVMLEFYPDANIDTDKLVRQTNELKGRFVSETSVLFNFKDKTCMLDPLKNFLQVIV